MLNVYRGSLKNLSVFFLFSVFIFSCSTGSGNVSPELYEDGWTVSTVAGSVGVGFADGPGEAAQFYGPGSAVPDSAGNIFVGDGGNRRIRKIDPNGNVSTIAGSTDGFAEGSGASALFAYPGRIALDKQGNIYVADARNNRIRKITNDGSWTVSTIAGSSKGFSGDGGPAALAKLDTPRGIALDADGNIYVTDPGKNRIRKIDTAGIITTVAGASTGTYGSGKPATQTRLQLPFGIAVDRTGNIYVTELTKNRIRKIDTSGIITTLAGKGTSGLLDGPGDLARFNYPYDIAVDDAGNVYVADEYNHRIRKIDPDGNVTTIAGSGSSKTKRGGFADGPGASALFSYPLGIWVNPEGTVIYVAEAGINQRIRKITRQP